MSEAQASGEAELHFFTPRKGKCKAQGSYQARADRQRTGGNRAEGTLIGVAPSSRGPKCPRRTQWRIKALAGS